MSKDIWYEIFKNLTPQEIDNVALTSKKLHDYVILDDIWIYKLNDEFPGSIQFKDSDMSYREFYSRIYLYLFNYNPDLLERTMSYHKNINDFFTHLESKDLNSGVLKYIISLLLQLVKTKDKRLENEVASLLYINLCRGYISIEMLKWFNDTYPQYSTTLGPNNVVKNGLDTLASYMYKFSESDEFYRNKYKYLLEYILDHFGLEETIGTVNDLEEMFYYLRFNNSEIRQAIKEITDSVIRK